ncbi:putative KR domain-containing protein [Colletotrichum scovillei]|uniref:Polyketide synthase n=1 Tax=Colletotrichum scovillei TaxID=1209932 RepID=A0A9P7QTE2_9PEZI|nr:putative KR domain-containing protein [Colletotrichum scovillei]KAF4778667.1 putative KR domain-containing protein [Colletotrichum scovillei]KAG7038609.1 polyketide synthase [Colletotrichum scovillei]KAG7040788.1 polyketide synthase [Colletotrichum scovillei]
MAPFMESIAETPPNGQLGSADAPPNAMEPIAICGMALRLPGGIATPEEFWQFLVDKKDARCQIPKSRFNASSYYSDTGKPGHIKTQHGYFLDDSVDLGALDTTFFRMPKNEVERGDPQQRLLLELTRECLESAGEVDYRGKTIGTFVGCFGEDWLETLTKDSEVVGQYKITGYGDFMLSNRLSYEYDLKGPSMTIRTGCSSALIGLHEACMSIQHGQCNAAIVAGSNLILAPGLYVSMSEQGVLSPNGSCRTFDAAADGYARGEAVNAVYVKRLSDAIRDGNPIRAVVRGTSSNADGKTPSLTIPSFESHEAMIRRAYSMAAISATGIALTGFVECHGTGTPAGDPIETRAIAKVFGDSGVHIGSCKPNIGHSEGASGITSLIKSIMALEHRTIPPNIKFDCPNPKIPFEEKNLKVPVEPTPWPEDRIERVSVNSFGIGGANAHVVVESAASFLGRFGRPSFPNSTSSIWDQAQLMTYSANTADSLRRQVVNNQKYIAEHPDSLNDIAYTLATRRIHLPHRAFSIMGNGVELSTSTFAKSPSTPADLALVFTGQGAQWPGMALELMLSNRVFAQSIRHMDKVLSLLPDGPSWTLMDELRKPKESSRLHEAYISQPLCTAVQIALVDTLRATASIKPFAVIGHSSGEMAAAYACGKLTSNEAIAAAYYRGVVSSEVTKSGAMAAVGMGRTDVTPFLRPGVGIACENSPSSVTISGDTHLVGAVLTQIRAAKPEALARLLKVDTAYHSHHMQEVGDRYLTLSSPHIDASKSTATSSPLMFSSVTGSLLPPGWVADAHYWRSNLESPVLFNAAVTKLIEAHKTHNSNHLVFLEVGPHSALAGPLRQILAQFSLNLSYASCLVRAKNATESFLAALGQLWQLGMEIDFNLLTNPERTANVVADMPSYPWHHDHSLLFSSRISDEWRHRRFPKHEILGVRVTESSLNEPVFRNMLSLDHVPWISDHNIKGDVIFPCAGYIGMAGEAARQLGTKDFAGYSMRNVVIDMAMVLSANKATEVITSLRKERLTDSLDSSWWDFTVTSFNGSTWMKHCSGQVKTLEDKAQALKKPLRDLPRDVNSGKWYQALRNVGANYGPYFQGLSDVTCSPAENVSAGTATHTIQNDSYYAIHPTKVDFFLQLFSVAAMKGIGHKLNIMNVPTSIEALDLYDCDSEVRMEVEATQTPRGLLLGSGFGLDSEEGTALSLKGVKLSPLENDVAEENVDPHAGARIFWQADIDFLKISDLIKPHSQQKAFSLTRNLTLSYIKEALRRLEGVVSVQPHLLRFLAWMQQQPVLPDVQDLNSNGIDLGPFGPLDVAMRVVLEHIGPIFRGETEPLEVLLPNNILTSVYDSLNITNREPLFRALGHSKPNLRILEVGAGTGGTTSKVLDWLRGPTGASLYSEYTYTDISAGFFSAAKERFSSSSNMSFKVLDISKDPTEQGIEPGTYDLVVAANVLHATPSLRETLVNVRKLLQPQGRLYMEELSYDALPLNFVMGILPGWWLGAEDQRPDQPHVSPERWELELRNAGFNGLEDVAYDSDRPNNLLAFMTARPMPAATTPRGVTILHDLTSLGLGKSLRDVLTEKGSPSVTLHDISDGLPSESSEFISVLDLKTPFFDGISPEAFYKFRGLVTQASNQQARILWLTGSSQLKCFDPRWGQTIGAARSIRNELSLDFATCEVDKINSSSLSAISQVIDKFQRTRHGTRSSSEYEYSILDGTVHIPRLYPISINDELQACRSDPGDLTHDLRIGRYGRLNTLDWYPKAKQPLGGDDVLIEAKAVGMNFKDVLIAMGIVDSSMSSLGLEAAGIVRETGPEVTTLVSGDKVFVFGGGCFSTGITISEKLCVKIPDSLAFQDAATMPCVFSTVIYGLLDIGRLTEGDSVLIHSACGGVGLAAIQICKMVGAEIYCTVGSDEKVQYLESTYGIPRERILNSRNDSFLGGIQDLTSGRGVDVVLNSLSGELLHASWNCVAEFGKMIEIGKRDLIGNGKLALNVFELNRSYHGVDLGHLIEIKPKEGNRLLRRIVEYYEQGYIGPITPTKVFGADMVEECFRYMQKGQHIGKIVVTMESMKTTLAVGSASNGQPSFDHDSSYLLVGGLGGLGRSVSTWMIEHGARHLVFLSRQSGETAEDQRFIAELEAQGCSAIAVRGDISSLADVDQAIQAGSRPVRGVINMSMVLRDQSFANMSHDEWTAAVNPKVKGTWNLHHACINAGLELDFFLLFSSISGTYGQRGQANYAGANTFLDAFVQYRQSLGLKAGVVDVGAMMDSGYVADNPILMERLMGQGIYGIRIPQLLDALALVLGAPEPIAQYPRASFFVNNAQVVIGHRSLTSLSDPANKVPWKEDRRMGYYFNLGNSQKSAASISSEQGALSAFLKSATADISILASSEASVFIARQIAVQLFHLLLKPVENEEEIDVSMSLQDAGLDSLVAVEMRGWWKGVFGFEISVLEMLGMGSLLALGERAVRGLKELVGEAGDERQEPGEKHDTEGYLKLKMP